MKKIKSPHNYNYRALLIILSCSLALLFAAYFYIRLTQINYPRVADYFLDWDVREEQVPMLAKYSLLILSPQAEERRPGLLKELKKLNPKIKILVYQLLEETSDKFLTEPAGSSAKIISQAVEDNNWWLRNTDGEKISYWPGYQMINPLVSNTGWAGFLVNHVTTQYLQKHPQYDGIFFDNPWREITWLPKQNLDFDGDKVSDTSTYWDERWRASISKIISGVRERNQGKIIVGNTPYDNYNGLLNGQLFENFGRSHDLSWREVIAAAQTNGYGFSPNYTIVNQTMDNQNNSADYQRMRYGLAATLLTDVYYSFDIGDCCHNSTWWYDEYNANLGHPLLPAEKLFPDNGWQARTIRDGVWRRVFTNGLALLNATDTVQTIQLDKKYHKIKGVQDPQVNNGEWVNTVTIQPRDGIILLNK